jgi:drug/metabolite transporter (DMT)-like permease
MVPKFGNFGEHTTVYLCACMSRAFKAHIALLAANLFFGINFTVMKYVTGHVMHPFALNLTRVMGAFVLFWLLYFVKKDSNHIDRQDRGRLVLCAVTGIIINQVLFTKGVSLTTPIHAGLLMMSCPIAIIFIAAWLLRERVSGSRIAGLALGVAGAAVLISLREQTRAGDNIPLGDTLVLINALSYAFYMVLVQPLLKKYDAVMITRWLFTIGLAAMVPLCIADFSQVHWQGMDGGDWLAVGFIVIAVTFCTYLFNSYGIPILGPAIAGAYIYTQPLFAAAIAIISGADTRYLGWKLLAAVLIFSGVYLVSAPKKS